MGSSSLAHCPGRARSSARGRNGDSFPDFPRANQERGGESCLLPRMSPLRTKNRESVPDAPSGGPRRPAGAVGCRSGVMPPAARASKALDLSRRLHGDRSPRWVSTVHRGSGRANSARGAGHASAPSIHRGNRTQNEGPVTEARWIEISPQSTPPKSGADDLAQQHRAGGEGEDGEPGADEEVP